MICSILIPTRERIPLLRKAIRSWLDSESSHDFEVIVRAQSDDLPTYNMVKDEFACDPRVRLFVGEPLDGYNSMHVFHFEMQEVAQGRWIWLASDDCCVEGKWLEGLNAIKGNAIIHAETEQSGFSKYHNHAGGPTPIVPKGTITLHGFDGSIDAGLHEHSVKQNWPTLFLPGITMNHSLAPRHKK